MLNHCISNKKNFTAVVSNIIYVIYMYIYMVQILLNVRHHSKSKSLFIFFAEDCNYSRGN